MLASAPRLSKPQPFARNHVLRDAFGRAVYDAMKANPSVYLFGEGAEVKQHYDAPMILRDFPERILTTPIAEDGLVNFALGAALLGIVPVVDIISADFLYRAMDSICNTAAKFNAVRPDQAPRTLVIRAEFMVGSPSTGQRPEALFAHIPGLTVHVPSTPADAYGLMATALKTPGVHLLFEDRMVADNGCFQPEDFYSPSVPFGRLSWRLRNPGASLTILTYGVMRQRVEALVSEHRGHVNLYDLRSIYPLDMTGIIDAVKRTGRLLIVEPDVVHAGVGAEIAAQVAERLPHEIPIGLGETHVRIKRLGAPRVTIPASMGLHARMLPSDQEILDAIAAVA